MDETRASFRPFQAWLVVVLALLAYILSNIDRQLISILIVPIQRDLGLSDTQFGVIQGVAYGLFYAAFCIPIAGLSDRFSRSLVMSGGLAFWSLATAFCGLASGFWRLFIARAFVGIGESSLVPAVFSLIGDLFPREKLGRAMGLFFIGPYLGSTCAFMLGGFAFHWLGENGQYVLLGFPFHTWQLTFFMAAAPGLLLALAITVLVRDPRSARSRAETRAPQPPFAEVLQFIFIKRRVLLINIAGFSLMAIPLYATFAWAPAYLIRTDGLSSAEAGVSLGSVALFAGCAGALLAGVMTDVLLARGRGAGPFEVGVFAGLSLSAAMAFFLLVQPQHAAIYAVGTAIFLGSFVMAPASAVIQIVAPSSLRSRVSAIFLVANLLIQTVAIVGVGVLNDLVFVGSRGIAISLPLFIGVAALGSGLILMAGRTTLAETIRTSPALNAGQAASESSPSPA